MGWSYAAFRAVVLFLTANRVDVALEDAVETLALADLYGITRLRTSCLLLIRSRIDVDSAIPMLLQADHVSTAACRLQLSLVETSPYCC